MSGQHAAPSLPLEQALTDPFLPTSVDTVKWLDGHIGHALCLGWSLTGSSFKPKVETRAPN